MTLKELFDCVSDPQEDGDQQEETVEAREIKKGEYSYEYQRNHN